MIMRAATAADESRILAWNEGDVHFLAPMDQARLAYLKERAAAVEVLESAGQPAGFVITFVEGAEYDSPNYAWFSRLEPRFQYVDRIVIDRAHRGRGLAAQVYASLSERHPDRPLVAEVNFAPPNPVSLAFHERAGFVEVGRLGGQPNGVVLLRRVPLSPAPGYSDGGHGVP